MAWWALLLLSSALAADPVINRIDRLIERENWEKAMEYGERQLAKAEDPTLIKHLRERMAVADYPRDLAADDVESWLAWLGRWEGTELTPTARNTASELMLRDQVDTASETALRLFARAWEDTPSGEQAMEMALDIAFVQAERSDAAADWRHIVETYMGNPRAMEAFDREASASLRLAGNSDDPDVWRGLLNRFNQDNVRAEAAIGLLASSIRLQMTDRALHPTPDGKVRGVLDSSELVMTWANDVPADTPMPQATLHVTMASGKRRTTVNASELAARRAQAIGLDVQVPETWGRINVQRTDEGADLQLPMVPGKWASESGSITKWELELSWDDITRRVVLEPTHSWQDVRPRGVVFALRGRRVVTLNMEDARFTTVAKGCDALSGDSRWLVTADCDNGRWVFGPDGTVVSDPTALPHPTPELRKSYSLDGPVERDGEQVWFWVKGDKNLADGLYVLGESGTPELRAEGAPGPWVHLGDRVLWASNGVLVASGSDAPLSNGELLDGPWLDDRGRAVWLEQRENMAVVRVLADEPKDLAEVELGQHRPTVAWNRAHSWLRIRANANSLVDLHTGKVHEISDPKAPTWWYGFPPTLRRDALEDEWLPTPSREILLSRGAATLLNPIEGASVTILHGVDRDDPRMLEGWSPDGLAFLFPDVTDPTDVATWGVVAPNMEFLSLGELRGAVWGGLRLSDMFEPVVPDGVMP